jgi:uncharacterized protein YcbX
MSRHRLTALHLYPIKSASGLTPAGWEVDGFGLRYDRRWVVVDADGVMMSQREFPRLALVRPSIGDESLLVEAGGMPTLELPLAVRHDESARVTIWRDTCAAIGTGPAASRWFSDLLETNCSLVHMPETTVRTADPAYDPTGSRVSFADAFPFLMISEESLVDLNRRLAVPVPMNRFRPNLVIAGGGAYDEDVLPPFRIGALRFRVVKPCDRCVITTVDEAMGRVGGPEPLRALSGYRKRDGKVVFGQNVVHEGGGRLCVGTALQV